MYTQDQLIVDITLDVPSSSFIEDERTSNVMSDRSLWASKISYKIDSNVKINDLMPLLLYQLM